ncbi:hypothetical protein OB69_14520 [Roseivirga seohaensis subsp. aquiponti]|uniref:Uncharacterized protein n=1 Tax=Roseivirga seohaensis subsp. aquiponti TaxID=1566026 RepID=A0A0L8AHR8_9BACT|nr:hypothetical protein OB69_14520 [Roseivirga seohaensis subsp. aquiponti]
MIIIGKKLSNVEMLNVKGGIYTCTCIYGDPNSFTCENLISCNAATAVECPDGEGTDSTCTKNETV